MTDLLPMAPFLFLAGTVVGFLVAVALVAVWNSTADAPGYETVSRLRKDLQECKPPTPPPTGPTETAKLKAKFDALGRGAG